MPERRFMIGGNWKSPLSHVALCAWPRQNGSKATVQKLISFLNSLQVPDNTDVLVAPPFLYLDWLLRELKSPLLVSAQTVSARKNGAFTGEVSAEQLKDFGVGWALVGHSERRHLFHCTDEEVGQQLAQALQHGLSVVACVGETEEERKADKTMTVISQQLTAIAAAIPSPAAWLSSMVLAYEPVWAIGTGQTATAQQAQEVHAAIRRWLQQHVSEDVSAGVRVIYGGSVQSKNAVELIRQPDVDGFLVGGASLKDEFGDIVAATKQANKPTSKA